jgi:menaquinol-cytochrome c reductase iron-sulfur subunit
MTRRYFFGLLVTGGAILVAGVVGAPALVAGLSPALAPRRKKRWRRVGRLNEFPVGWTTESAIPRDEQSWPRPLREQAVFVWRRSEADIVVFSRSCTDLGCPLDYDRGSTCFYCPCHGGVFTQDGQRLMGPPKGPMYRYTHRVRNGVLEIDVSSIPAGA